MLLVALLLASPVWSANDQVLVVGDASRPYFRAFVTALTAGLGRGGFSVEVADLQQGALGSAAGYRCIVTVGHDAARQIAARPGSTPVLHALVTSALADELRGANRTAAPRAYLLIEQPAARLLLLATTTRQGRERLGVIYGPSSVNYREEVRRQVRLTDYTLVEREIGREAELADALAYFKGNVDVLVTFPDPVVVNEGTAKTLILGAYLGNLPLVGYSQALVKAGALMSLYATPEMLGAQSADLINSGFWGDPARSGAKIYPLDFEVAVNYQVARALGVDLPDESELASRIRRAERAK